MSKPHTFEGRTVADAIGTVLLDITAEDIKAAKRKTADCCPIAVACKRDIKATEVRVHLSRIYIRKTLKGGWVRYCTPMSLRSEIIAYDRGGKFQAGEYLLAPLPPTQRLGMRTGASRQPKAPKVKRKIFSPAKNVRANAHA